MRNKQRLLWVRRLSQGLFLLLFLWLFLSTESKGANDLGYPVRIFLDADPLLALTTALASRSLAGPFLLALIVAVLTVLLGRVFCGWICPFGTLHHLAGLLARPRQRRPAQARTGFRAGAYRIKYLLLIFLVTAAVFGVQAAGLLDPLSLLVRSLVLAVYPAFTFAVRSFFDALYGIPGVQILSEPLYGVVKAAVLPFSQPVFYQAVAIGILFALLLALNAVERRFWCRYLCPLGALLGLLSRWSLLSRRVDEGCNGCGSCRDFCQGDAAPDGRENWRKAECLVCLNCDDPCPRNAVSFGFFPSRAAAFDLGKRRVLAAGAAGLAAVPLLKVTPLSRAAAMEPSLIRPPGALPEAAFLQRCVKCGECMKVCITGGLQPALLEGGLEGLWTPVLVPKIGYCEHHCTLCGQVCPTEAIRRLSLEEKKATRIGSAMIDPGRCLPYAHGTPCLVCEEMCPVSPKAIRLVETTVTDAAGRRRTLKQPRVDLERCIGCGICEAKCPVLGKTAIAVTGLGESRSQDRQLILGG